MCSVNRLDGLLAKKMGHLFTSVILDSGMGGGIFFFTQDGGGHLFPSTVRLIPWQGFTVSPLPHS